MNEKRADRREVYYVYILYSKRDRKLYIGSTGDLRRRYKEHEGGLVESTKNRRPLLLIYYEAFLLKGPAIKQELLYKTGQGRRILKKRLELILINIK